MQIKFLFGCSIPELAVANPNRFSASTGIRKVFNLSR